MQHPAGTGQIPDYFSSQGPGKIFLTCVLLAALLCVPALAAPISAGITPGSPSSGNQLSAAAYEHQGMAQMAQRDWSGVIITTNEGLTIYPDNGELYCLRAYALRKTGYFAEAVDNTSRGILLDPKPARYANRGYALLALGRNSDALLDADAAIALNASYAPAYDVKTIALIRMNNLTGARQAIDTAMPLDPENPLLWQLKAKIAAAEGNCTAAREAFHRSIAIDPEYNLPWPGFDNATTDLKNTETRCAAPPSTPVPTQASFPAVLAGVAVVLAVLTRKR